MSIKIELAKALAANAHEGQKYGVYDYFLHIEDVVERVYEFTKDFPWEKKEQCIVAAYLHDVLEDSDVYTDTIWNLFGEDTWLTLLLSSKSFCNVDKEGNVVRTNSKSYLKYIEGVRSDDVALIVKICDTRSNLRASLRDNDYKRIEKYNTQLMLLEKP